MTAEPEPQRCAACGREGQKLVPGKPRPDDLLPVFFLGQIRLACRDCAMKLVLERIIRRPKP
jgi:hypothetical protein